MLIVQAKYTLTCDCTGASCSGSFGVSYDGAFSPYTDIHSPPSTLIGLLGDLRTIASSLSSGVNISSSAVSICVNGAAVNHTISLFSPLSSLPHIQLWPSIYYNTSSGNYKQAQISGNNEFTQLYINQNTVNANRYNSSTRAVLQLLPGDNRNDNIQLCNGVGKCNFQTGACSCPFVSDTTPLSLYGVHAYSYLLLL